MLAAACEALTPANRNTSAAGVCWHPAAFRKARLWFAWMSAPLAIRSLIVLAWLLATARLNAPSSSTWMSAPWSSKRRTVSALPTVTANWSAKPRSTLPRLIAPAGCSA